MARARRTKSANRPCDLENDATSTYSAALAKYGAPLIKPINHLLSAIPNASGKDKLAPLL